MTNEDIIAYYPRRIERGAHYEIWQFPYVKDGVFYDNFDLAVVQFLKNQNIVTLFSEYKNRLEDCDYIARVQLLVHDISNCFDVKTQLVRDIFSDETDALVAMLIEKADGMDTRNCLPD